MRLNEDDIPGFNKWVHTPAMCLEPQQAAAVE